MKYRIAPIRLIGINSTRISSTNANDGVRPFHNALSVLFFSEPLRESVSISTSEHSVRCAHEITGTITAWPHFVVLSHLGQRTFLRSTPIDVKQREAQR
jgi:hypothetical protein